MTPPPEYTPYDDGQHQSHLWSTGSPYAGQQSLAVHDLYAFGSQHDMDVWPSTSSLDDSRPGSAGAWEQESGWQVQAPRPATSGNNDGGIAHRFTQGAAIVDRIAARVNEMRSRGDREQVDVGEVENLARSLDLEEEREEEEARSTTPVRAPRIRSTSTAGGIVNFKKSWLYQNSRLPPGMVPFAAYLPTWALISRAADASCQVYDRPRRDEREGYTDADPKLGTKATIVRSQTMDDKKLLIVAIRGSQKNIVDWNINFSLAPKQPVGFLDDEGNACHAGFLQVARAMISTVAAQLRQHIEQDPSWAGCSLLFCGHSAGGAVASLLYMHMLSRTVVSDLTALAGIFLRIHCINFGSPPVSLLPLQLSTTRTKNQFLSFANEGDLVVRADWAYTKSLAKLLAVPAPIPSNGNRLRERVSRRNLRADAAARNATLVTRWPVPDASLSAAGRMVLLRERPHSKTHAVEAVKLTDEELRGVVFGDPAMHRMSLYKQRVDELGFAALSGREVG